MLTLLSKLPISCTFAGLMALILPVGAPSQGVSLADEELLPAPARQYLLDGPDIYEVGRRSKDLIVQDLNGDGLLDMAVFTNEKSLLQLFYQEKDPQENEKPFREEVLTLDRIVRMAVSLDVDGDGRMDLLMSSSPPRLSVMYQNDSGGLESPVEVPVEAQRLSLGDLTGDGRDDVLVYNEQKFQVLPSQKRGISLEPSMEFYTTGEPASHPMIIDFDGDGRNDIVYHNSRSFEELVVRLQSSEKTFPFETRMETATLRLVAPVDRGRGEKGAIAAVHNVTRSMILLEMDGQRNDGGQASPVPLSRFQTIPFNTDLRSGNTYPTAADVNGDGRTDVVVASPDLSTMRVYFQSRGGTLEEKQMPTLQGVEEVIPVSDGRGKPQGLVLFSSGEKAVAYARYHEESDVMPFPKVLPVSGEPRGVAVFDAGDERVLAVIGSEDGSGLPVLKGYPLGEAGKLGEGRSLFAEGQPKEKTSLSDMDIVGLEALDINRDGRRDLVVYADFKAAAILMQNENGQFEEFRATSTVLEGLLSGAKPRLIDAAQFGFGETGESALALKEQFLRAFTIDDQGNVEVEHQLNGRNASARLQAAAVGSLRGKDSREVVLLDRGNRVLTIYGRESGNPGFELLVNTELDNGDYNAVRVFDLDGDGKDDILLSADDRLTVIYTRPFQTELKTIARAATADEEGGYGMLYPAELTAGGDPEIAAIEMKENLMELFLLGEDKEGNPALHRFYQFKMFDNERTVARQVNLNAPAEPRALQAADLDDDGRNEIVTLMHDNIVIYFPTDESDQEQ